MVPASRVLYSLRTLARAHNCLFYRVDHESESGLDLDRDPGRVHDHGRSWTWEDAPEDIQRHILCRSSTGY